MKSEELEKRFQSLLDTPTALWKDEDLQFVASIGLSAGNPESSELHWLRLSGLSALQKLEKPLRLSTGWDFGWLGVEGKKTGIYSLEVDKKVIRDFGPRSSKDYFKGCLKKEREGVEEYIKKNWNFLVKNFPIYVTSWFKAQYQLFEEYDREPDSVDWNIFFSLLDPKPPKDPLIKFGVVIGRWLTIQREKLKPQLIRNIWNDKELREKVLRGEPLPYQWEVICPYSTIYSSIKRAQEVENQRRTIRRSIDKSLYNYNKKLIPLFKQNLEAQEQGIEVTFQTQ